MKVYPSVEPAFQMGPQKRLVSFWFAVSAVDGVPHVEQIATDRNWHGIVVFCEFWGEHSFAGKHEFVDRNTLTPIDVAIYKQGLMSPADFVGKFNDPFDLRYLGGRTWDREFVDAAKSSSLEGMAFEGVVGKSGRGHKRLAIKLKYGAWITKVLAKYGKERGRNVIES